MTMNMNSIKQYLNPELMNLRIKYIFRGMAFKPVNRQVDIDPVYECITNKLISYKSGEQQTKMANMNLRTNEKKICQ